MPALQREAGWALERLLGDLQQPVAQNGRVHLHTIDNFVLQMRHPFQTVLETVLGQRLKFCCARQGGCLPSGWGFGVAMLPVGASSYFWAHVGHIVLPIWAHVFYSLVLFKAQLT